MSQDGSGGVGKWLAETLRKERLSLRQAAAKSGLSHVTIGGVISGTRPSPDTIKKLATAFGDGDNQRVALEDRLFILAGYRTQLSPGELSEPKARLMDKLSLLNESQLRVMGRFADFLLEVEKK